MQCEAEGDFEGAAAVYLKLRERYPTDPVSTRERERDRADLLVLLFFTFLSLYSSLIMTLTLPFFTLFLSTIGGMEAVGGPGEGRGGPA
jgi:hypothetical protein